MKTILITLFALITANANSASNALFKSNVNNEAGQVKQTTVYNQNKNKGLSPLKQFEYTYNQAGKVATKTEYVWNVIDAKWNQSYRYIYEYTLDGNLSVLSYTVFDKSKNSWKDNIKYAMYVYETNGNLLAVHYIDSNDTSIYMNGYELTQE